MARNRVHGHKACTQEMFVILDGVKRSHDCIFFSIPWEYGHFIFSVECFHDFSFRASVSFHGTVTVALTNGAIQNLFHFLRCQLIGIRSCLTPSLFLEEARLQIFGYMFINSFFGILLHTGIDSGINLQSVYIQIVVGTVFLFILRTPAIQRVGFPG